MANNRYLIDFNTKELETEFCDVIIIGSGIAGVYTALEIPEDLRVTILTKERIEISASVLAQGGIAVSLDEDDSPDLHFKDTIYAGAGLCDEDAVWVLVNEAKKNIEALCKYEINFDMKNKDELSLTREGAHSKNRIIHAGDTTGKEVLDRLIAVLKDKKNVSIKERTFAIDLITENNECKGVIAFDEKREKYILYVSNVVVCASGGYGQLYKNTTNPEVATGDGIALAYRAGAEIMDMEFIQFHPTVLYHPQNMNFLISEALRGEGALLKNVHGERFMPGYSRLNELAPRDIVSRAIFKEMKKSGANHVYLDISFKEKEYLENRFPNIFKTCFKYGVDISKDKIPVYPAQHYCMGGISSDVFGRTGIKGLYSCGESACSGIHGANRLASNSLLEGLVFGSKIGNEVKTVVKRNDMPKINIIYKSGRIHKNIDRDAIRKDIKELMMQFAGIVRDGEGLKRAENKLEEYYDVLKDMKNESIKDFELQNILTLARIVVKSALMREESRGSHFRTDFIDTDDINWKRNIKINVR